MNFDTFHSRLEGTNLIEASAGTGKTYTITWLFLRLILEKGLTVNQILVVTFTEAATEELRDRIRTRIREAAEGCLTGAFAEPQLETLIASCGPKQNALESLRQALRDFDQAAIFTIHGFCKRMLHENAFESNSLFDTELETDNIRLRQSLIEDFWRNQTYVQSRLFVNYLLSTKFLPGELGKLFSPNSMLPNLRLIPDAAERDLTAAERKFHAAFDEVAEAWQANHDEIQQLLLDAPGFKQVSYKKEKIAGWIDEMDGFIRFGRDESLLFENFGRFTRSALAEATKKNYAPPDHRFFALCETLLAARDELTEIYADQLRALKRKLILYVREKLPEQKRRLNILHFEDLLFNFHHALMAEGGDALAQKIREKYCAALIDEFQDTDSVQYEIFSRLFSAPPGVLFMIGDPKQAIYSFRGADVFAYMKASRTANARYSLDTNRRSERNLVQAVNVIFSRAVNPFIYPAIGFEKVAAADEIKQGPLLLYGKSEPPLQLWFLNAAQVSDSDKAMSKETARNSIYPAVAAEIARLLNLASHGEARFGGRSLDAGDIAVLVRKNSEAREMKRRLTAMGIPSVLYSAENLFDSGEALEMQRFLAAVIEPNREALLRAALTTDMIGLRGEQIDHLLRSEMDWEFWLLKFQNLHEVWRRRGFMTMFRQFLTEFSVQNRLMNFPDGERRNTNILHLAEVLHHQAIEKKWGMSELAQWLAEQRDPDAVRLEEHQLRLESDEKAVKLVTIHKSKGLQYPIVFCPFLWNGSTIGKNETFFMFHDEMNQDQLTLDMGSEYAEEHRRAAEKELLAENLRLLYVALTRAINRCYLAWGQINDAETSALAYLFHQPAEVGGTDRIAAVRERFLKMDSASLLSELKSLGSAAPESIAVSELPPGVGVTYQPDVSNQFELACRTFDGRIDSAWRITSFSALTSRVQPDQEIADYDATTAGDESRLAAEDETVAPAESATIFQFPRGAASGIFLHKVFEELDFVGISNADNANILRNKMAEYRIGSGWFPALSNMIKNVLSAPLPGRGGAFSLSQIPKNDRLNELEFYVPLKRLTADRLKIAFGKAGLTRSGEPLPGRIGQLVFSPAEGFLRGFIDLVFQHDGRYYIIDWKSNYLGARVGDYDETALRVAMDQSHYTFQYLLYTLALHQYLKYRIPGYDYETMFGGVFYIFLRGVDPSLGASFGVFADRPSGQAVDSLCRDLIVPAVD
ncbi:MAG: exodeoxyribonuclease V subunit beta [Candidatus Zhuqueibacterota bacterium]